MPDSRNLALRMLGPVYSPPEVWAVEDTCVQVTWGDLPPGPVRLSTVADRTTNGAADGHAVETLHDGGPGGLELGGLQPNTDYRLRLTAADGSATALTAQTLQPPPGELLSRFATISDLHLGAVRWGALKSMTDQSDHPVPHPYRCASAAISEAQAWGAELLVIKGDAAQHESDRDFDEVGKLVDQFSELPMLLIPGNHDVDGWSGSIPLTIGARRLPYSRMTDHVDLPGCRLVVADTTIAGRGRGSLVRTESRILETVRESDRPVYIGLHHQLQSTRFPRYWPIGVGAVESMAFLHRLQSVDQPVIVSSGHTHRNRSKMEGQVLVTEVGSTKDWPCVWAGYAVYEGGIRQVVRRIVSPTAISWAEYSRTAVGGLWGRWSPGQITERCVSHAWARNTSLGLEAGQSV